MDLALVMDQVAARVDTIPGLNAFKFPPEGILATPAAVMAYPDDYTYDETFGRGRDSMTLPLIVMVDKVSDQAARDNLLAYAKPFGPTSVKALLESGQYTAFHVIRVVQAVFEIHTYNGVDYPGITFSLYITGSGS